MSIEYLDTTVTRHHQLATSSMSSATATQEEQRASQSHPNIKVMDESPEVITSIGYSGLLSLLGLFNTVLLWALSVPALVIALGYVESQFTKSAEPVYLIQLLAVVAPFVSIAAMAAPLLSVVAALVKQTPVQGLQAPLYIAFASSCILGVAYGLRKGLTSVALSSGCGFLVQCVSLAACYHLAEWPTKWANFLSDKMRPGSANTVGSSLLKCAMYAFLLVLCAGTLFGLAMTVPFKTMLSPIYTLSCLFPYIATFSTFPNDLRAYRTWKAMEPGPKKERGPPGVDLKTLYVMQFNNTLWCSFGILLLDSAVLISSSVGLVFAAIQILCFKAPLLFITIGFDTFSSKTRRTQIAIDLGWLFVGSEYAMSPSGLRPTRSRGLSNDATPSLIQMAEDAERCT